MSSYYTKPSTVIDGDTIFAADVNSGYDSAEVAFDNVEAAIAGIPDNVAVGLNTTHRTGDGSDHADVASNTAHSGGNGSDHGDVALNNAHRVGDGSDHADVAANTLKLSGIEEGAEVNNISDSNADDLTDGSNADTLHRHNSLKNTSGSSKVYVDSVGNTVEINSPLHVYGNIYTTYTIDGRDISVDGAKLDGIESGAEVNSGLESVHEGFYTGYRLVGEYPANHGDIGANSVDMTYSGSSSTTIGATGGFSFSAGNNTTASGFYSTALGNTTVASGQQSMAVNSNTVAQNTAQFSCGYYNKGTSSTTVLEVGAGSSSVRANVLEVHKDGNIVMPAIPTSDPGIVGALWNDSGILKISL